MNRWNVLKQDLLRKPAVKNAYQKLEPEHKLAQEFLRARIRMNLTQAQVAKKAGMSQVMVARLESGTANPTLETMSRVASALDQEIKLISHR